MYYAQVDSLNEKMKLARPIFNKKGDMLFAYGAPVTLEVMNMARKLGLCGICILDASENATSFSKEDIEFERLRSRCVYAITDELKEVIVTHRLHRIEYITDEIIETYGKHAVKINFYQDLRNNSDIVSRHTFNVAVLSALIMGRLGYTMNEKRRCIKSCLIHDIGKTLVPEYLLEGEESDEVLRILNNSQDTGFELIDTLFPEESEIKGICVQAHRVITEHNFGRNKCPDHMYKESEIMVVADTFESMSAIDLDGSGRQKSFPAVFKYLNSYPDVFNPAIVKALMESIVIISSGTNVILSNGNKALVMSENANTPLYPVVLEFGTNKMIDLSDREGCNGLEIVDVANSLDSRYRMK